MPFFESSQLLDDEPPSNFRELPISKLAAAKKQLEAQQAQTRAQQAELLAAQGMLSGLRLEEGVTSALTLLSHDSDSATSTPPELTHSDTESEGDSSDDAIIAQHEPNVTILDASTEVRPALTSPERFRQSLITSFHDPDVKTWAPLLSCYIKTSHPVQPVTRGTTLLLTDAIRNRTEAIKKRSKTGADPQKNLDSTSRGVASQGGLEEPTRTTGALLTKDGDLNTPSLAQAGTGSDFPLLDVDAQKSLNGGVLSPSYHDGEVVGIIVDNIYEIKPSKLGGLGAFALEKIEAGDLVLLERPLLKSSDLALGQNLAKLSEMELRVFHSLHPYSRNDMTRLYKKIWHANAFWSGDYASVYEVASRFNHSCSNRSNVTYNFDFMRGIMVFQAKRAIEIGEELTITYKTLHSSDLGILAWIYGFNCTCGGHADFTEKDFDKWLTSLY